VSDNVEKLFEPDIYIHNKLSIFARAFHTVTIPVVYGYTALVSNPKGRKDTRVD